MLRRPQSLAEHAGSPKCLLRSLCPLSPPDTPLTCANGCMGTGLFVAHTQDNTDHTILQAHHGIMRLAGGTSSQHTPQNFCDTSSPGWLTQLSASDCLLLSRRALLTAVALQKCCCHTQIALLPFLCGRVCRLGAKQSTELSVC